MKSLFPFLTVCSILFSSSACAEPAPSFSRVVISTGAVATEIEGRYADLLEERIRFKSGVEIERVSEGAEADPHSLVILLGVPARHAQLGVALAENRVEIPTEKDPGPEGFLLRSFKASDGGVLALAAGVEKRSVLYAAGEILRRMSFYEDTVRFPVGLDFIAAPGFPVRGTMSSQGHTMLNLTGARKWTGEEWRRSVLDYALAGANTFAGGHVDSQGEDSFQFYEDYGFKTLTHQSGNPSVGGPEWAATEAIGRKGHSCPSIPEAREAMLRQIENKYKNSRSYDFIQFYSGDGGGCECDRCYPYGGTYIRTIADMAAIINKYHPETEFVATNQKLDNAGEAAILEYLQDEPRDWLKAISYGPGSNAMGWQPGRRQDHRMDLFRYRRFGQIDGYLRELLHQLPPQQEIMLFTDLTHWVYSQYGLKDHEDIPDRDYNTPPRVDYRMYANQPDPAMAMVYDRRTFNARPRNYYNAFQHTMRYAIGDVAYSEGHHDHFNQWMWQRLMWDPHKSVEEVVEEYARTHFGPEAAPLMAKAIFQHEQNLSTPIGDNDGIEQVYDLLVEAGKKIPTNLLEKDHLWRQYMQRAALDRYIKLRYARQVQRGSDVENAIEKGLESGDLLGAVETAKALFDEPIETAPMKTFREEAGKLGDESEAIYGVRNTGYFNLEVDFLGTGWIRRQIDLAAGAKTDEERKVILHRVAHYEDPGPGGYYDDAGDPENSPHLTYGWPFGESGYSDSNRPSQRRLAFTTDEKVGVTFEYDDLDPETSYRVRLTLLRPSYLPRYAVFQPQTSQSVYADEVRLEKDVELPERDCEFFEYDIPKEVTSDGKLKLWFEKSEGVGEGSRPELTVWRNTGGWGTLVSEVWLMKK